MPEKGDSLIACNVRRTYTYTDENGIDCTIQINAKSNKEADKRFQEFLLGGMKPSKSKAPTLQTFVEETYRDSLMNGLSPTTIKNYNCYLKYFIYPFLGKMPMDEITVATIQAFQNWMAEGSKHGMKQDINEKTITRVCGFAGRIFRVASEMKIIEDTPIKSTLLKNPGKAAGHHKALPDEKMAQIKRDLPQLADDQERLYMALLVYTGMRREEILGLRWEDIHLEDCYATIQRAVTYPGQNKPHIGSPKAEKSGRTVPLVTPLIEILQPLKQPEGFVLGGENPLCYSTAARVKKRAFDALGIIGYNNHDFRTTLGTQLKESGMSSALVSDVMGHADTRMVETVYARTRHEGVMKQLDALERLNAG